MYAIIVLVDRAGRTEACVALDVVDRSGSGVQTEVLDFVECVIVLLERLCLTCSHKDVIVDFGISRGTSGVLYIGKIRVLNEIAAGSLLSRRHDRNSVGRKQCCCKRKESRSLFSGFAFVFAHYKINLLKLVSWEAHRMSSDNKWA